MKGQDSKLLKWERIMTLLIGFEKGLWEMERSLRKREFKSELDS
jgi:hypothetical protein